jgi:hypothetical protein
MRYPGSEIIAISNERSSLESSMKFKAMGMRTGVSDLLILTTKDNITNIMWLEMKTKTGKLSPEQKKWLESRKASNEIAYVAYGLQQAVEIFCKHFNITEQEFYNKK